MLSLKNLKQGKGILLRPGSQDSLQRPARPGEKADFCSFPEFGFFSFSIFTTKSLMMKVGLPRGTEVCVCVPYPFTTPESVRTAEETVGEPG